MASESHRPEKIKYAPLENCEEFIIHKKLYDCSHESEFKEGDDVWGIFEEIGPETRIPQWFAGIIKNVDPLCDETLYNKYTVKWLTDEKIDQQSGWNLVKRVNDEQPEIILSETEISDETRKRMIENLRVVITSQIIEVEAYFYEVEEEYRDEYEKMVPYPTNLTKIKDRLETNFYRTKSGLLWEIALLHENCALFNGSNDSDSNGMFSMSKTLSDALAEAVDNPKRSGKVFLDLLQTRIDRTDQEIVSKEENQASSDDEPEAQETEESESEEAPKSILTNRAENQRSSSGFSSSRRVSTRFQSEDPLPENELEEYISAVSQSERFKQRLLKELRNLPARVQKEKLRDLKPSIFETSSKRKSTRLKRHRLSSSEEDEEEEEDSDFEKENRGRPAKRPRPIRRKQLSSEPEENELDESSEIKEDAEESSDEDHISEVASDHDQESEEDDDEIPLPSYRRRGRKISENFSDEARDGYGEQNTRRSVRRRSSRFSENSSSNSRPSRQSTRKKKTLYNFEDSDEDFSN
ncbi:unnamed protein product [Oikopleura dioica]|uniref:Bromo domain-containing protein n=1 Tax=Oikopleura dioica TaxID=34765 RepID=E4YKT5_OIKDI|nr:unnamed protein product [Oikopleura dioica]